MHWRSVAAALLLALLPACAMLEPDMRDVPKAKPVSMAQQAPPAPVTFLPEATPVMVPRSHVVARGDTLLAVARRHGVQPAEVARLNGLDAPYTISVGRVLRLPGEVQAAAPTVAAEVPAAIQAAAMVRQAQAGAPAPDAAPRGSITVAALPPPEAKPIETKPAEARPVEAKPLEAAAAPSAPKPPPAAPVQPEPPATVAAAPVPPPMNTAVPAPPPRSAGGFLMPVDGRIIVAFGPQPGGLSNDGINIAAPRGTPVKAAEHGVVVYAGNELRGFGNMLLVRHEGGWMTAYAHLATMAVYRGNKVERGQPIGTVGMTGNVTTPQLHFEIRQGKQPVDPEKQLAGAPPRTAQLGAAR